MKFLHKKSDHVVHYGALHLASDTLANVEFMRQRVAQDFATGDIDISDCGRYNLILDFRGEGQCDKTARPLIEYLQSLGFRSVTVLYSTVQDTSTLPYAALSDPLYMTHIGQWPQSVSMDIDTKFLCLIRRPSHPRAHIAQAMLAMSSVRLTFGSGEPDYALGEFRSYFPGVDLPLTLDGGIYGDLWHLRLDARNPLFAKSLINAVVETSDQVSPNAWRSVFITEKTFKAFALRQVPVWFAVPGLVSAVRQLGFDCFDDIIDHSYDNLADQDQRYNTVLTQLKNFDCTYSLSQCQHLRHQLADRLESNWQRLCGMVESQRTYQQLLEHFNLDRPI